MRAWKNNPNPHLHPLVLGYACYAFILCVAAYILVIGYTCCMPSSFVHIFILMEMFFYTCMTSIYELSLQTPDDSSRVCLTEVSGVEGSDYINASFIAVRNTFLLSTLA